MIHAIDHIYIPITGPSDHDDDVDQLRLLDWGKHHFFIDCDQESMQALRNWCSTECHGKTRIYPEFRVGNALTSTHLMFHLTIDLDRDATLFKLSW
jgi:hypothetical protein